MNEKNRKFLTEILDITKIFFTALAIAITVNSCLIANASVPTGSMETTVMTGAGLSSIAFPTSLTVLNVVILSVLSYQMTGPASI